MSHFPDYKRATNAAYNTLIGLGTFSISTDVFAIVELLLENCRLLTYGQACFLYGFSLQQLLENSEFGFSILCSNGNRIILYNENNPLGCIRFTIAHEIGHAILCHVTENDPSSEKEANCFARNLLCPLPVADALGASTVDDYTELFNVTASMAMATLDWRTSDKYYLDIELSTIITDMLDAYNRGFDSIDEYLYYLAS